MPKISNKQYIIAIGASAGGLEAISAFFDHTPLDAVSYILIQHLSSDFKSQMAQILTPHSKLEIIEVKEDIIIQSNKIYLIPSSKFMAIDDGRLILSEKNDKARPHMTIDQFFISLAKERGDKAIGIILSGSGHDGSKGIEAIKKSGGMVIVQDPATASLMKCRYRLLPPGNRILFYRQKLCRR
jgi:two-component system CheB/CheR fusion protein